jgi:hypothetical protein
VLRLVRAVPPVPPPDGLGLHSGRARVLQHFHASHLLDSAPVDLGVGGLRAEMRRGPARSASTGMQHSRDRGAGRLGPIPLSRGFCGRFGW